MNRELRLALYQGCHYVEADLRGRKYTPDWLLTVGNWNKGHRMEIHL